MDDTSNNTATQPHPSQISSTFRQAANFYQIQRGETVGVYDGDQQSMPTPQDPEMLGWMIQTLMQTADQPPSAAKGVPDDFIVGLDRVSRKELQRRSDEKKDDSCPICSNPFLEDPHPLVVRLPCHPNHVFDLECIQPWLTLNVTCPLDRKELVKVETDSERIARILGKRPSEKVEAEDAEDDADGMYG